MSLDDQSQTQSSQITTLTTSPRGLHNLGNTCYLNTTLQALSFCPSFLKFFIYFDQDSNTPFFNQLKDIYTKLHLQKKEVVPKGLIAALENSSIGNIIDIKHPNDMHEFLGLFVDELLEEQKRIDNLRCLKHIIYGRQQSCIICSHCGYQSINTEGFTSIMLSFDEQLNQNQDQNKMIDLKDMISYAFQDENVESRTCDNCHQKRDEKKKTSIYRLPQVLILMIKRYDYKGRRINKAINVPYNLDISPLMIRPWKKNIEHRIKEHKESKSYTIKSIACHYGNLHNGHYYTICRDSVNQKWYQINDEEVRELKVLPNSSQYYVLFYEKN